MANIAPTTTVTPVAGSTAGEFTFATQYINGNIYNGTGDILYIKLFSSADELTSEGAASASQADVVLPDKGSFTGKWAELGFSKVVKISTWSPTGATVGGIIIGGGN